jgi:hypothetical protein
MIINTRINVFYRLCTFLTPIATMANPMCISVTIKINRSFVTTSCDRISQRIVKSTTFLTAYATFATYFLIILSSGGILCIICGVIYDKRVSTIAYLHQSSELWVKHSEIMGIPSTFSGRHTHQHRYPPNK